MKTGLILEGGAMRGMFTCGILDVFLENGIEFDMTVGVSAGACFGCNYKSRQIGRGLRYNMKYCQDKRYASFWNYIKEGNLFGVDFCYNKLPFELDIWDSKTFKENPMEFYAVCTDVTTGKAVYHRCIDGLKEDIDYFRASASMPIVSRVVEIGDERLLDGGVADSIPIRFAIDKGCDKNVVILTQPKGYFKKKSKSIFVARILHWKYPKLVYALKRRHQNYNDSLAFIEKLENENKILVIRPPESLNIPHMTRNPDELSRVYLVGREEGLKRLSEIKEYLDI